MNKSIRTGVDILSKQRFLTSVKHGQQNFLERIGEILDKGYNVFLSPEGNITTNGELLPFHSGAGYIAVEMEVPVTIFKLNGYFKLWPADKKRKLNLIWPKKRGTAEVIISEPITFSKNTSYDEATRILREKMLSLE